MLEDFQYVAIMKLMFFARFPNLQNHGHHLLRDFLLSRNMLQQQFAGLRALGMRLVHDDRKLRSHVGGSVTIRKTDDGHILRNPEPLSSPIVCSRATS